MAVSPKIDFDELYDIENISEDLRYSYFNSKLENGKDISLSVKISNQCHVLLPNVYNISFGPLNARGKINDKAELTHSDYSKVFSTILFFCLRIPQEQSRSLPGYRWLRQCQGLFLFQGAAAEL